MQLKFRAWNGKEMIEPHLVVVYLGAGYVEKPSFDLNRINLEDGEEVELMQFTGLTDKNGKDIYEGDLLQNDSGRIGKVVWHKYTASWDTNVVYSSGRDNFIGFKPVEWGSRITVIGNIHQHPELMDRGNNND